MSEFFQRRRVYRWLREMIVLLLLAAVLMWGVDRFRSPTLPDTFSGTTMQTIDGQQLDFAAMSCWFTSGRPGAASAALPRRRLRN